MAKAVGIDLGTTNSVIAAVEGTAEGDPDNAEGSDDTVGGRLHRHRGAAGGPAGQADKRS